MSEIKSEISWDEFFMRHVYLAATKSKDPRTKIGAVLVKNGIVISEGYNGFPRGVLDLEDRYNDRELKYKFVVHGEANAVLNAVRHSVSPIGSICYTQEIPCHECTKLLLQVGVIEIVTHALWPFHGGQWEESVKLSQQMCQEAGVLIRSIDTFLDVIAYVNGRKFIV